MFEGDIFVSYGQVMIENPAAWDVNYDLEHSSPSSGAPPGSPR